MNHSIVVVLVLMTLTGCSTAPKGPVVPTGKTKTSVNNPATVAHVMSDYYRGEAQKRARLEPARVLSRLTINQIIERHLPDDFRVFASDGVDLTAAVDYETSRPWIEAIGGPLSDVGIEMTADLVQKTMMLRVGVTTVEQILNRSVPADYMVYADESVRLDMPIKLDRSKPWMEALGMALAAVGVSMTANVDQKMVILKPNPRSRVVRFSGEVPAPLGANKERKIEQFNN